MNRRIAMNILDYIYWGWYHILLHTIHSMKKAGTARSDAKLHSFVITYLLHGLNVLTIAKILYFKFAGGVLSLPVSLGILFPLLAIGYFFFYRKRADKVTHYNLRGYQGALGVLMATVYAVITAYAMLATGDYLRYMLHPEAPNNMIFPDFLKS